MSSPGGIWLVACAGSLTLGASAYGFHKALTESYCDHLISNGIMQCWNIVLKMGVIAQAAVVGIFGQLTLYAATRADPA